MFLGAGSRSKTSVRQRLTLKLAAALVNTTPSDGSVVASKLAGSALGSGVSMVNGTLVQSVAGSALTVALKTLAGTDPTASDPVYLVFRNATAATGDYAALTVTSALSLVISSGSTLGTQNATAFRLWLVAFNDAGTVRLALINCVNAPGVPNIYPLGQFPIASSTAEGGAGAADAVWTFYTGTAVTSKAYAVLGYLSWEAGLATAGTWSAAATRLELFRPWTPLPGTLISQVESRDGAVATGVTSVPNDDTIPQSAEGNQYLSQAIQPVSTSNVLRIQAQASFAATTPVRIIMALFQDAVANALATAPGHAGTATRLLGYFVLDWQMLAGTTSSTTFKIRAGNTDSVTTITFNGETSARLYGGTVASYLRVQEIQG